MDTLLLGRLQDLAVFTAVVEQGTFSRAATALGMVKSGVSRRVSRLETELGVKILQRTTRSLSLTEAGEALYASAKQSFEMLGDASTRAGESATSAKGVLKVTASVSFGRHCIVPLLPRFRARHPAIEVDLNLLDRPVDLVEEGVDVAIRLSSTLPESAVAKRVRRIRYCLCASPDFLAEHELKAPEDLIGAPCLSYRGAPGKKRWTLRKGAELRSVAVTQPVRVNNSDAMADLAVAGCGVALLADYAADEHLRHGSLHTVLPAWEPEGTFGDWAYAVWQPQKRVPMKVRLFLDLLAEEMGSKSG